MTSLSFDNTVTEGAQYAHTRFARSVPKWAGIGTGVCFALVGGCLALGGALSHPLASALWSEYVGVGIGLIVLGGVTARAAPSIRRGPRSITVAPGGFSLLWEQGRSVDYVWKGLGRNLRIEDYRTLPGGEFQGVPCRLGFGLIGIPGAACDAIVASARSAGLKVTEQALVIIGRNKGKGLIYTIQSPRPHATSSVL